MGISIKQMSLKWGRKIFYKTRSKNTEISHSKNTEVSRSKNTEISRSKTLRYHAQTLRYHASEHAGQTLGVNSQKNYLCTFWWKIENMLVGL